jgi:hypothetical protein
MRCRPTGQENHQARNIFRFANPSVWRFLAEGVWSPVHVHQSAGHLGGKETRGDGIGQDVSRTQLYGQSLGEADGSRLGGRVCEGTVLARGADANPGHGGGDDHSRRILLCGLGLEERREPVKHVVSTCICGEMRSSDVLGFTFE